MFSARNIKVARRFDFALIHWIPTLTIFVAFAGVTLVNWHDAKDRAYQDRQEHLSENLSQTSHTLLTRVEGYNSLVKAGAGLVKGSDNVTREDWKQLTEVFDIDNSYPAVTGLGYSVVIPQSELAQHEAQVRASGIPNYNIHPGGNRSIYTSVLYYESKDDPDSVPATIGYDLYTDATRKYFYDQALASGQPTITDKIYPLTDTTKANPSFAIYYPVFKSNKNSGPLSAADGFAQLGVHINLLFENLLTGPDQSKLGYRIYNGEAKAENLLYQTLNFDSISKAEDHVSQSRTVSLNNANWVIEANGGTDIGIPEVQEQPTNILVAGLLGAFLMSTLVYIILVSRTRSVAMAQESKVQGAKDELLALASHQLRTPATGVKQYVGMLKEGYVGDLTDDQIKVVEKAYDSNEQQLQIISDMLSVARADAGRLPIRPNKVELGGLLKDIVEQQQKNFDERQQKVSLKIPKKPVVSSVDPQYFRMAIGNILDNAGKYTPERGAIEVSLKAGKSLTIRIDDTGVGIPERHYPLMFKKFSRIPNELASHVSGSGIGLYLAKHIVEAHGGQLSFRSEAGVGSSFIIKLPTD